MADQLKTALQLLDEIDKLTGQLYSFRIFGDGSGAILNGDDEEIACFSTSTEFIEKLTRMRDELKS